MMFPMQSSDRRTLMFALASVFAVVGVIATGDDEILLESFEHPIHTWREMNDPVMGGRSTGSFRIEDNLGIFEGEVANVPFLHAPGFIQVRTTDNTPFADVSQCTALQLVLRTNNPEYTGYRVSFGNAHAPGGKWHAYGYKANLEHVPGDEEFSKVVIPFTDFTDFWDDATGDPIHTCHENKLYCPDSKVLQNMKTVAVWGEGVLGKVSLELRSISAVGCFSGHVEIVKERISNYSPYKRHMLRGWSQQLSLSTLFFNWFWN